MFTPVPINQWPQEYVVGLDTAPQPSYTVETLMVREPNGEWKVQGIKYSPERFELGME